MNFKNMPELDWEFGYPLAIGLMIISIILALIYFKMRKWINKMDKIVNSLP
jgi:magnesium transporter